MSDTVEPDLAELRRQHTELHAKRRELLHQAQTLEVEAMRLAWRITALEEPWRLQAQEGDNCPKCGGPLVPSPYLDEPDLRCDEYGWTGNGR